MTAVVIVNVLFVFLAGVFGVVGIARPAMLVAGEQVTPGVTLYSYVYGVRSIVLSIATIAALLAADQAVTVRLLVISGLIQAADAALGVQRRIAGMAFGGGLAAVIHLVSAWWMS